MAAGRVTITFDDSGPADEQRDWQRLVQDGTVCSNTGQLQWNETGRGYFTINTPDTQGLVGFAAGQELRLGDFNLKTSNEFAVILITSLEKERGIAEARSLLLTAMARVKNSGMTYSEEASELLTVGTAPMLLEPVQFTLQFTHRQPRQISFLDHLGRPDGRRIAATDGKISVDGAESKTCYYLIEF